jgi:hypothetical protein
VLPEKNRSVRRDSGGSLPRGVNAASAARPAAYRIQAGTDRAAGAPTSAAISSTRVLTVVAPASPTMITSPSTPGADAAESNARHMSRM